MKVCVQYYVWQFDTCNYEVCECVSSICSCTFFHISYITTPSCHTHGHTSSCPLGETETLILNVCTVSIQQYLLHLSAEEAACVFVSEEQMDSAPCHLYYLQECDMSVPRGMGTKEESCHPPADLPLVRVASICLIYSSLTAAWRSFSQRTHGEREGELLQIWPMQALRGEVSLFGHFCSPSLLSDWGTIGGVEWVSGGCDVVCACVCTYSLIFMHVIWLISWSH